MRHRRNRYLTPKQWAGLRLQHQPLDLLHLHPLGKLLKHKLSKMPKVVVMAVAVAAANYCTSTAIAKSLNSIVANGDRRVIANPLIAVQEQRIKPLLQFFD